MRENDAGFTENVSVFVSDLCSIAPTKSRSPKKDMTKRKFSRSLPVRLAKVR